uniref:U7 snRNA-associated Sm-like protein LSm10 n=1 Tax=Culex pipiens TaxID=7175 RepID=A0A8D8GDM6_CULPI
MSRMTDKKERYNSFNDLTALTQCLVDRNILIDLRNETSVAGKITNVDGFMNISMENVVYIDELGKQFRMDEFMIYPRYIRYIHIPKELEIKPVLEQHFANLSGARKQQQKPVRRTYKMKRAQQNQLETLAENYLP